MLSGQDRHFISLTLKTYNTRNGLASRIHATDIEEETLKTADKEVCSELIPTENAYFIKGPMGKGLQLKPTGIHVAFCAGTGVLAFLDLVASLLIKNSLEASGS